MKIEEIRVGMAFCRNCGFTWVAVVPEKKYPQRQSVDLTKLECKRCAEMTGEINTLQEQKDDLDCGNVEEMNEVCGHDSEEETEEKKDG